MDMLSRRTRIDHSEAGEETPASLSGLIEQLIGFVRRQYLVFVIVPAAALAIGFAYLLVTPAKYTATATLLIDSSTLRVLQNQLQPQGDIPLDTLQIGSQVEILASRNIAQAVIRDLNLADDPEFVASGPRLWPAGPDTSSKEDREARAISELLSNRSIVRAERTYALFISYTSRSPVMAAKIANAIADAYIDDQLGAKYQTISRASSWLQDRINELKSKITAADRAVLEFKEKNNIIDFGGANGSAPANSSSRLIGEQQLFELNSQLATARGATGEAKARLDRIEQVRKMDVSEAAVADILKNDIVTRLRNQYLDLSAREANLSARYGWDHAAAANLRDQMEELRRNIGAELGRVAASYQSDYEIAKTREENLERALTSLVTEGQVTNRDRLGLTELESSAKIYHTIYDNFLQRYMEAIQQQSFPITDARVINAAIPPGQKSKPIASLILAVAATMGLFVSLGIAGLREAFDVVFRTPRQVEQALKAKCLAVIPLSAVQSQPTASSGPLAALRAIIPVRSQPRSLAGGTDLDTGQSNPEAAPGEKEASGPSHYAFADPLMGHAADNPLSVFAEAFRAIKVTAWLRAALRENKVIGVTSTLPNEGKSTIACNLAALMAHAGKRIILVDADLRKPTLAGALIPRPSFGWMDVLNGTADLSQAIGHEPDTGLALLPLLTAEQPAHADEILSSQAFKGLIDVLRQRYDCIIVDLPPIAPVVDVRAAVPLIDSFVFVVEWGNTRIKAAQRHLMAEPELRDRLLGVVLNKADLKSLEKFEFGVDRAGYYTGGGYRLD